MKITPSMDLPALAERMGTEATPAEAREMRIILCDSPYHTTEEIPERVWTRMVSEAIDTVAFTD